MKSSLWTPARPTGPATSPGASDRACVIFPGSIALRRRNESLRYATGDWIMWLDADERITGPNRAKIKRLFARLGQENKAYGLSLLHLPGPGSMLTTEVRDVRLFHNHPGIRWQNRIYEDILPALHAVGAAVEWTDIAIEHAGYQDPVARARKYERNLRLLQMDYAEDADNPSTLFSLGRTYLAMECPADALPLLRRGVNHLAAGDSLGRGLYRLIVQCLQTLGQPQAALAECGAARADYPLDAGLRSAGGPIAGAARRRRRRRKLLSAPFARTGTEPLWRAAGGFA